jgi:ATP-dependent helicase HrpB
VAQAQDLLQQLGALDSEGRITAHGKAMAQWGAHPRLAHMMLRSKSIDAGVLACEVAAILTEREILRGTALARVICFGVLRSCVISPSIFSP